QFEPGCQVIIADSYIPDSDFKPVAGERAAREFPRMSVSLEHLEFGRPNACPRLEGLFGPGHSEPLDSDGATILESSESNVHRTATASARKRACNPLRVGVALSHLQQNMLACPGWEKAQVLFYDEVIRLGSQSARTESRTGTTRRIEGVPRPQLTNRHREAVRLLEPRCLPCDPETPSARWSSL